ncbi:MAG TPA: DUF1697 domain-containing protein [Micromonosporaceae bacterium]
MNTFLALLRGINVGTSNRIGMADLRALLGRLGYTDVRTHLQSGNAVFTCSATDSDEIAGQIEAAIADELGLKIRCLVRDRDDLRRVVEANPLADIATDPARLLVTFLSATPDAERLAAIDVAGDCRERFVAHGRELYVWLPDGVRNAKLSYAFFEKKLGVTATARNWNTVTKLLSMMGVG